MATDTPPLFLSQVLEDEYVKLHGAEPPTYPESATEDQRLATLYKLIHALPQKRSAFCISGGGIRSATFALGIIQGLSRCGVLDKFDYLSTVSGGGYIGSWLTAWTHRHGMNHILAELTKEQRSPLAPEPGPVSRLRDYSSYLNPKLGLLSADSWTLVATVLRNLLLNWFVLIPLLAAVLMIPRFGVPVLQLTVPNHLANWCLGVGCVCLLWAIGYIGLHRPSAGLLCGDQRGYLTWCLLPLTLASILLITYWAWGGHSLGWQTPIHKNLAGWNINIREDLVVFMFLGIVINFIAFLAGIVVRFRGVNKRTILLEVIVIIFTGALGGCLVWSIATVLFPDPLKSPTTTLLYVCFASPLFLAALLVAESIFVGLSSFWTSDHDREWWSRSGAWILIYVVVWSVASALLIFGPMGLLWLGTEFRTLAASVGGISGVITILAGRSSKTSSKGVSETDRTQKGGKSQSLLLHYALELAAPIFAVFLVLLVALGSEILFHRSIPRIWSDYRDQLLTTTFVSLLIFVSLLALVGFVMGVFININKFSLHAMYRNRLIRAYLGASREMREPNLFTGFDEEDNIQMHELWPNRQPPHEDPPRQPFHVLNMALNLVAGEKLAWQQRKAESFTASPLHAGSYCEDVGYRRTENKVDGKTVYYGGREGISLGTALAISGAAASPNMGYHSSPIVGFLMTLFNARLGWWLGNPGQAGRRTYNLAGPVLGAKPMIDEALGLTDDRNKYIYLSDGGHFENLALYEMVLRRCHTIVVSDAGQDGGFRFEDLGGAVRKIRIDFGIPITFDQGIKIYSREQNTKGYYCAIGTIGYSCVDGAGTDGILIYIKPTFYGTEPADVYQHAQSNKAFPHDSTADQWFDESQFESYRMLGSYIIGLICEHDDKAKADKDKKDDTKKKVSKDESLDDFVEKVREYLARPVERELDQRSNRPTNLNEI